jgi:hypothetical protein
MKVYLKLAWHFGGLTAAIIGAALLGGWPGALIVVGAWAVLGTIADLLVDVMNRRA